MSCDNENISDTNLEKLYELTNKLNSCNKNVKLVLDLLQKLHEASEKKTTPYNKDTRDGTYENKRNVYVTKLNNKEIKQPKQTTLDYYKIEWDENKEKILTKMILIKQDTYHTVNS
jgi:pyruvate formate-lyase activating enzyme-like uncharacterized protein